MGSGASASNAWLSQAAPEKQAPVLRCEVCGRSLAKRSYRTAANGDVLCIACWDEQPHSPEHKRRMSGKRLSNASLRSGGAMSAWQAQGAADKNMVSSQAGGRIADGAMCTASEPLSATKVDRSAAMRETVSQPLQGPQRSGRSRSSMAPLQPLTTAWAAPDSRLPHTGGATAARRNRPASKTPSQGTDSGDLRPSSQSLSRAGSQSQLSMRSSTKQSGSEISTASRSTSTGGVGSWTLHSNAERNCAHEEDGLSKSASLRPLRLPLRDAGFETKTWPVDKFNPTTSAPPAMRTAHKELDVQVFESDHESADSLSDMSSSHRRRRQSQDQTLPPVTTAAGTRSRRPQNRKYEVKKFHNGNTILLNHSERKHECLLWE
mmetsp:Transcript_6679/g.11699  ORF Transcript_6679/g.11699 Transcript_6679/m.11699 type:complete len:377 (-) Transcript_6679:43-1173(-)